MNNNLKNLPATLKTNGLFCLWRAESRNGCAKPTKIPYQVNGRRASSADKTHFRAFDTVIKAAENVPCNGIGLGLFDGICAIDIDHCCKNGELSDMAKDVISTMNSYTELSPSGEGVRILFRADAVQYDKARWYINNQSLGLEVYVSGVTSKYVTLTGNKLSGDAVEERSAQLMTVLEKYMKREYSVQPKAVQNKKSGISDDALLSRACRSKYSSKFSFLWNGGIPTGKSLSEADISLCYILAFCGGNASQIDRLFRRSRLYRAKWDREDYRTVTISKAMALAESLRGWVKSSF